MRRSVLITLHSAHPMPPSVIPSEPGVLADGDEESADNGA
jgi:hypothetical protein